MRKHAEAVDKIRRRQPGQIRACFASVIPDHLLAMSSGQRRRGFDCETTFWAFLGQSLRNGSCRDALLEVQAARANADLEPLSASTSSYCTARKERLSVETIRSVHEHVGNQLVDSSAQGWRWHGREVYAVDGTSVSLADTPENQESFPQPGGQKPGCGFPVMQLVGLFHLGSGALGDFQESPWYAHENSVFYGLGLIDRLEPGSVLTADRAYCSFLNFATLQGRGVDVVARLHQARKPVFPKGSDETTVEWKRPAACQRPDYIADTDWESLPDSIRVRYIRVRIEVDGFRPSEIVLATTMMDISAEEIAELFLRRWNMELSFRDLKTTLGMDNLMVRTPEMGRKTVAMYFLAHNLVRWTMQQAAVEENVELERLSFKGTLDILEHWKSGMEKRTKPGQRHAHWRKLLRHISQDTNPDRPNRSEPRAVKRRPKKYQLLTKPRAEMKVSESRRQK